MIKFDNPQIYGFDAAIRGCRNSYNSWDKSDSYNAANYTCQADFESDKLTGLIGKNCDWELYKSTPMLYCDEFGSVLICNYIIGKNDLALMKKLVAAGSDHRKFLRMIVVTVDITAPAYLWPELDSYKVGTVRNSCSFMHMGVSKPFELSDFTIEEGCESEILKIIEMLNFLRNLYLQTKDFKYFRMIRQILPQGYLIKSTWQANYEVLRNIYHARKNHRLDEWVTFTNWIESLPYSELITEVKNNG